MSEIDLDDLRAELDGFAKPEKKGGRTAREERIIAGFEEIQRFVDQQGHAPRHGEGLDIFERMYAVRLDRIRSVEECRSLLSTLDHQGLLKHEPSKETGDNEIDDDELAAELAGAAGSSDITSLQHVRKSSEKQAADEIAQRTKCEDFERFKPLFARVKEDLKTGVREASEVHTLEEIQMAKIQAGEFFIVEGQIAYVAEVGEEIRTTKDERRDSRLRVIYDNGTESDVLLRSFQRALHRDKTARLIASPSAGPLFSDEATADDQESGTIYVLRSQSELPIVSQNRNVLHKIGVTGRSNVKARFANAKNDATFLLADVEIVATYDLYNINRVKLEKLIHKVFEPARLDVEIKDRFGKPVVPREWFLVPVFVIDEVVERIKNGSITNYVYDPKKARLVRA